MKTKKSVTDVKKTVNDENVVQPNFVVRWFKRIFYTLFLAVAVYVMLLSVTVMIPAFISFIIDGIGFKMQSYREIVTALLAGGFFTAWLFVFTYAIGKRMWALYMRGLKGTMSAETLAKWEELHAEDK
jgi:hypothetical protein